MVIQNTSLCPEEIDYIKALSEAGKSFRPVDGKWTFIDTGHLYTNPSLKSLAQRIVKTTSKRDGTRKDYDLTNVMNAIYTEILFSGFLGEALDTTIHHFSTSLGYGDGGIDGYIHGVPYDLKTTSQPGASSRVPGGKGNPWRKHLYVFSTLIPNQEGVQALTLEGYAWRNEAMPYFIEDASQPKVLKAMGGFRVAYTALEMKSVLEVDVSKLRDGKDHRLFQELTWDSLLKRPAWVNTEKHMEDNQRRA